VPRNLLGIRGIRDLRQSESEALLSATDRLVHEVRIDQRFTAADVCHFHRSWLREIYPWAGEYRQVNLSKGDLIFASAREVPRLMKALEKGDLAKHTPCRPGPAVEVASSLAVVHAELVLIHPFRDGNGRVARLLATLMALQAGLPPLDFGGLDRKGKPRYFSAVRAALGRDYEPLTRLFGATIARSLRSAAGASRV
jgi:cell filamentation protein